MMVLLGQNMLRAVNKMLFWNKTATVSDGVPILISLHPPRDPDTTSN
jgi:hypothetical protein